MTAGNENLFVTVRVEVRVPVNGSTVKSIADQCLAAARQGAEKALVMIQDQAQRLCADQIERRQWRARSVLTRLGRLQVRALQVRDRRTGRSFQLLNALTGLEPRQTSAADLDEKALRARVEGLSYRRASALIGSHFGAPCSHMWLWRRVQKYGARRAASERRAAQAVFDRDGQLAPCSSSLSSSSSSCPDPPAHLYLEADELHVKAQRSRAATHRIKTGLSYTGRRRLEGTRTPRWELVDKRLYLGVESLADFGARWSAALQRRYGLWDAPAVLYLSDGDPALRSVADWHFPQAVRQMDWAHVLRDVSAAAPDEETRKRWTSLVARGRHHEIQPELTQLLRTRSERSEPRQKLSRVLAANGDDLQGWRRFRDLHDPQRTQRIPRATGAVEKNQETLLVRAMKGRGMAWSAPGANHLVKLIKASLYHEEWKSIFQEPPPPLT